MKICVAVCEFNPFHNGHALFLQNCRTLTGADAVVCLLSGNFTQRGEIATLEKRERAKIALSAGADLVFELPAPVAVANAERFARGALAVTEGVPAKFALCCGVEEGDAATYRAAAEFFGDEPKEYRAEVRALLREGVSLPEARQKALLAFSKTAPETKAFFPLLRQPNATLALEYAKACKVRGVEFFCYQRTGRHGETSLPTENGETSLPERHGGTSPLERHNETSLPAEEGGTSLPERYGEKANDQTRRKNDRRAACGSGFCDYSGEFLRGAEIAVSSAAIRKIIAEGRKEAAKGLVPTACLSLLPDELPCADEMIFGALLSKNAGDLALLPDCSEGLENRLFSALSTATDYADLLEKVKTKRYVLSRIRRMGACALLGVSEELSEGAAKTAPYLRLLGKKNSAAAKEALAAFSEGASPLLTKQKEVEGLDGLAKESYAADRRGEAAFHYLTGKEFPFFVTEE